MHGIYKISSVIYPERFYIGSAVKLERRKNDHFRRLRNNEHPNNKLQNHVNKYGIEDLVFEILEEVKDIILLVPREQYHIDILKPYFNLCIIAGSQLGMKRSEETKEKMRLKAIRKREPLTLERRANISKAMTGKKRGKYKTSENKILLEIVEREDKCTQSS